MVAVGEKLGDRHFITAVTDTSAGSTVEVRDAQGTQFRGQILHARAVSQAEFDAIVEKIKQVPARLHFHLPDLVLQTAHGEPVALYGGDPWLPLTSRLLSMFTGGIDDRRRAAMRTLQTLFVALAEALHEMHDAGAVHGAITLDRLMVHEDRGTERLVLGGFGLGAAVEVTTKQAIKRRADLAALVLALDAAMERVHTRPEGGALVRWEMLRNCAKAGDHPSLEHGRALAAALRQLTEELRRPSGVTAAVGGPPARPSGTTPAVGGPPMRPSGVTAAVGARPLRAPTPSGEVPVTPGAPTLRPPTPTAVPKPSPLPPPAAATTSAQSAPGGPMGFTVPPPTDSREGSRRRAMVLGGASLCVLVVAGAVVALSRSGHGARDDALPGMLRTRVSSTPGCAEESVASPPSAPWSAPLDESALACVGAGPTLALFGRAGSSLSAALRPATRGARYLDRSLSLSDRVRELGTALSTDRGAWIAWRPTEGAAFAAARVDESVHPAAITTPAWESAGFEGASLLKAGDAGVWVASTLKRAEGPLAMVVFLSTAGGDPITVYRVAEGSVAAVIPGDPATLLLHRRDGTSHELRAATVPLAALPGLSSAGAVAGDAGAPAGPPMRVVSDAAIARGAAWSTRGASLAVAPTGAGDATSTRSFLVVTREAADPSGCAGLRCPVEGAVQVLGFPPQGDAVAYDVAPAGRALTMGPGPDQSAVAVYQTAAGVRGWSLARDGSTTAMTPSSAWSLPGAGTRCGDEVWSVFRPAGPRPALAAMPTRCALARGR